MRPSDSRLFTRWHTWMARRGSYRLVMLNPDGRGAPGKETMPYLGRYFLFRLGKRFGLFLHIFYSSDPEGLHDHPWPSGGIIIQGGYQELHHDGTMDWRPRGHICWYRPARTLHRIVIEHPHACGEVMSLFWHTKRNRQWGYLEQDGTWVASQDNVSHSPLKGWFFPHADSMKAVD